MSFDYFASVLAFMNRSKHCIAKTVQFFLFSSLKFSSLLNFTLFHALLKIDAVEGSSSHCPLNVLFKESPVDLKLVGRLTIQRVLRIRLQEQVLKAVNDGIDCENCRKKYIDA